jgi:pyruvate kinase
MDNKSKIFEYLYKNKENSYNINQISRLVGISVGSAFKILKNFEENSHVHIKKENNAILYQINLNNNARKLYEELEIKRNKENKNKTKIVCTIGPSSENLVIIKKLVENGMDIARIDVSNHNQDSVSRITKNIRKVAGHIPILIDIPGKDITSVKPWIKFAVKNDLDFVNVSYVSNTKEIESLYTYLGYSNMKEVIGGKIKLFVKVQQHTLRKYKEIIKDVYGIILDRNFLATSKEYELLPRLQKEIIRECNKNGKPVIVGSQLLESMNSNKLPSKAEVYDIANAVLDKTSCLMLSETESGKYPVESTNTLRKVIRNVEMGQENDASSENVLAGPIELFQEDKNASIDSILIITSGGYTARIVSSKRPGCKIIAATSSKKIFRQLNVLWGVKPLFINANLEDISTEEKKEAILKALTKGFIKKTDQIAIIASVFHSRSKRANLLEVHLVNEFLDYLNEGKK